MRHVRLGKTDFVLVNSMAFEDNCDICTKAREVWHHHTHLGWSNQVGAMMRASRIVCARLEQTSTAGK
jgi:hypothetical protein